METAGEFGRAAAADLARLNPGEREVLRLLGDGHTAKSIASLTGRSVVSVNERLRQARRKTGVTSSRELARLLKAQKNRHDEIGMVFAAPGTASSTPRTFTARGVIVMSSLLIAAGISFALQFQPARQDAPQQQAVPAVQKDPLIRDIFPPADQDPRRLSELVRTEARDPVWADSAEAALRARYAGLVRQGRLELLRVACAKSACEVIGTITVKGNARVNAVMQDLQDAKRNELGASLKLASAGFGRRFASHWYRPR